ncbi:MAG: alpha/beta fold hydrolase [Flavobacteriales bacterium]
MSVTRRIVLIHGFTERPSMWDAIIEGIQSESMAISTPSIPGHGNHPEIPDSRTARAYCEAIIRQLPDDGLPLIVVGHSMGGYLASCLVTMIPERIQALGLFHSKAAADDDMKKEDRLRAIAAASQNRELYLATMLRNTLAECNVERLRDALNAMIENAKEDISVECIEASHQVMIERPDNVSFLRQASFGIHYFLGREDKSIPFDVVQREIIQLSGASVQVLENTGHMGQLESPAEARKWLKQLCSN